MRPSASVRVYRHPGKMAMSLCSEPTDCQIYFQCQHSSCQASDHNEVTAYPAFFLEDVHADAGGYRLLTEFAFLLLVAEEARNGRMCLFAFSCPTEFAPFPNVKDSPSCYRAS